MAETDNNTPGGVNDPLKMRNTETAALKRMPVSPNSASASSAARKTIKLKPLVPSSANASSAGAPPTASMPKTVAPPSILLNRKPAAPKTEEPPKFMSTNTAPIGKMAKPSPEKPISPSSLGDAPTKTVSIPRLQAKMASKPVIPVSAPASAPASASPVATATVSVPKITKPAPAPAPASASPVATATVSVPKITKPAPAPASASPVATATVSVPKITKPAPAPAPASASPVATATVSVPKITKPASAPAPADSAPKVSKPIVSSPVGAAATGFIPKLTKTGSFPKMQAPTPSSPTVVLDDPAQTATTTQGIQKQAIDQAKMQSGLQGAKPAIKLRPSASPAQDPEALSPASPTIKLTPKADSTVTPMPPPPEPAAENTSSARIPRKTLQLKPKMPSSGEAQMREQGDIANQKIKEGVEEGEQTIQQAGVDAVETPVKKKVPVDKSEPNIIFSICAILAFLVIGYTVFALSAQFLSVWEGKQIPVIGFQQISRSAK